MPSNSTPGRMAEKSFGQMLREAREDKGLTLREVAEEVDLSFGHLGKVEKGIRPPPQYRILIQLSSLLEIDFDLLFAAAVRETMRLSLLRLFCHYSDRPQAELGAGEIRAKFPEEEIYKLISNWLHSLPESAWPPELREALEGL